MKIIITGATGFVGKLIISELNKINIKILLVGRSLKKLKKIYPNNKVCEYNELIKFADDYEGKEIPRPDHWGGVIIQPEKVEVWKSRDDYKTRLHDRIVFTLSNDQWTKSRLYP